MAFFTKTNVTVPVLPVDMPEERVKYTVDRTLGVEV